MSNYQTGVADYMEVLIMNKREIAEKDILNKNEELNEIPEETACSHEFSKGCISGDQAEQE
jgi:hypothetical protein